MEWELLSDESKPVPQVCAFVSFVIYQKKAFRHHASVGLQ